MPVNLAPVVDILDRMNQQFQEERALFDQERRRASEAAEEDRQLTQQVVQTWSEQQTQLVKENESLRNQTIESLLQLVKTQEELMRTKELLEKSLAREREFEKQADDLQQRMTRLEARSDVRGRADPTPLCGPCNGESEVTAEKKTRP